MWIQSVTYLTLSGMHFYINRTFVKIRIHGLFGSLMMNQILKFDDDSL